jgi:predicted peptidase
MKYLSIFFILTTVIPVTAQDPDLNLFQKRSFISSLGDTLPYRILFPAHYEQGKKYPVVLFLHGGGERGTDNEKQLMHGATLFLKSENRRDFPCIVIFPQCPSESYWGSVKIDRSKSPLDLNFDYSRSQTPALTSAIELLQKTIREERANNSQIYIMGLSMGGMGTYEAIYHYPKLFAAAVAVCGGGDAARYNKTVKKIPFWIFHGDKDAVVGVEHSRSMVTRLEALKADVKYTEYPEVNHNSWDYAFAEPELLRWLFSHKR